MAHSLTSIKQYGEMAMLSGWKAGMLFRAKKLK
jgi:hypothetical protein